MNFDIGLFDEICFRIALYRREQEDQHAVEGNFYTANGAWTNIGNNILHELNPHHPFGDGTMIF